MKIRSLLLLSIVNFGVVAPAATELDASVVGTVTDLVIQEDGKPPVEDWEKYLNNPNDTTPSTEDIPFLGYYFKGKAFGKERSNMCLYITPAHHVSTLESCCTLLFELGSPDTYVESRKQLEKTKFFGRAKLDYLTNWASEWNDNSPDEIINLYTLVVKYAQEKVASLVFPCRSEDSEAVQAERTRHMKLLITHVRDRIRFQQNPIKIAAYIFEYFSKIPTLL